MIFLIICSFSLDLNRANNNRRRINNNNNNRRQNLNRNSKNDFVYDDDDPTNSDLDTGKMGTRLYDALMRLECSDLLENTFAALGNYINKADDDFSKLLNGQQKYDLSRFPPDQRQKIKNQLSSLGNAVAPLNEGFNKILIPNVQNSRSILDIPKAFRDPTFQARRSNLLTNIKKLAQLGLYPGEVMPTGFPALLEIISALKDDVTSLSIDKLKCLL